MTALIGVPPGRHPVTHADDLEPAEAAALAVALDEIPAAAFVVWADGRIVCSNRPGRAALERAPDDVASGLLASLGGTGGAFRVTRVLAPGAPNHYIAVQVEGAVDPAPRVAAATASMGFTPRQAQVLRLLALGRSNKAIANELGCAESTVEIHVTAVLGKSRCGSRCELVSRFWSEPMNRAPAGMPRDFRQYRRGVGSARPGASCAV
ncbi:MAG: transcriptional regulator, LuxR family [Anaeromyxobacteraceae bacterium]|nr:transcriptional regulator, LuxR family [Anaeromyxobacteraceae bacterium]